MSNAEDSLGLNPEESERLKELKDALEGEFLKSASETRQETATKDIEDLKPDFLAALKHVVKFSTNDSLRSKVAMWGYDKLLEQNKANTDPLYELINGMEKVRAVVPAQVHQQDTLPYEDDGA
jgi:hypothetical protein